MSLPPLLPPEQPQLPAVPSLQAPASVNPDPERFPLSPPPHSCFPHGSQPSSESPDSRCQPEESLRQTAPQFQKVRPLSPEKLRKIPFHSTAYRRIPQQAPPGSLLHFPRKDLPLRPLQIHPLQPHLPAVPAHCCHRKTPAEVRLRFHCPPYSRSRSPYLHGTDPSGLPIRLWTASPPLSLPPATRQNMCSKSSQTQAPVRIFFSIPSVSFCFPP